MNRVGGSLQIDKSDEELSVLAKLCVSLLEGKDKIYGQWWIY